MIEISGLQGKLHNFNSISWKNTHFHYKPTIAPEDLKVNHEIWVQYCVDTFDITYMEDLAVSFVFTCLCYTKVILCTCHNKPVLLRYAYLLTYEGHQNRCSVVVAKTWALPPFWTQQYWRNKWYIHTLYKLIAIRCNVYISVFIFIFNIIYMYTCKIHV